MKKLIATAVLSACSMAYANTDIPNYNTDSHLYEFTQTYDLVAPKGFARTSESVGAFTI